jgi:ADP-heptose:LPS heptosyltransferase
VKPKLLIVELWGLGDLTIASPLLRAAVKRFDVTLLAKPFARDLQSRFWPDVTVVPFLAPWTAFRFQHKYRLWSWPWRQLFHLRGLRGGFETGLSARWDPRDHLLLAWMRAKERLGFPRVSSQIFLTQPLQRPAPAAHRYEYWRTLAQALDLELPPLEKVFSSNLKRGQILIHSGAGQPVRVWPLPRYQKLATWLRQNGRSVQIACDPDQRNWWLQAGESNVATPHTVTELITLIDRAGVFIGNDSGPGHLAALAGVPTFTLFGPQLPEWFAPIHPAAEWNEGRNCPYKPCSDYCRFPAPFCLHGVTEEEIRGQVEQFVARRL